jgi:hypothetical protein
MQHRVMSRRARIAIAAAVTAALTTGSMASVHLASAAPVVQQSLAPASARVAVDPVGSYEWSLVMASMDNTSITGTLKVTRTDSTLAATLTSDHSDGELPASSVKLDGNRLTVVSNGDFGAFTVYINFKDDSLDGTFHFVGQDGSAADGPLSIKRSAK